MAVGMFTVDNVDFNAVLNRYELPQREAWNLHATAAFRQMFCSDIDEGYTEFALERLKFQELGPMAKPDPQMQVWGKKSRDVRKFGMGWTYTWEYLARATTNRINRTMADIRLVDEDMLNALILAAIFDSATHYGLLNGLFGTNVALSAPPSYGQNTFLSNHTHYFTTQTAGLTTTTPISQAKEHMAQHGDHGPYVALINSHNVFDIEQMARWDTAGANVSNPITDRVAVNGFRGRMLGCDWFETEWVPADYIIFVSAPRAKQLMGFVEMANAAARGLLLFNDQTPITRDSLANTPTGSYPLVGSYYLRYFNNYVLRRSAAVVVQISASGTFVQPTTTTNILMSATAA